MDEGGSGIELSLLEGMDESLLARLHRAKIRTREELGTRLATPDAREALALELGVSPRRIEILHHLNFLLPEERVDQLLDLERQVEERLGHANRELRLIWRAFMGLTLAIVAALVLAVAFLRPFGEPLPRTEPDADPAAGVPGADGAAGLAARVAVLEERLGVLAPVARAEADDMVLEELAHMGPAPGWRGALRWNDAHHDRLLSLAGDRPEASPPRAISLILIELAALERTPNQAVDPMIRARQAASLYGEFPDLDGLTDVWDAAIVLLQQRVRGRALGLVPPPEKPLPATAAEPWDWTHPGYLQSEELTARLEALPVREDVVTVWSETLAEIRRLCDRAREDLGDRNEAAARHYWVRRTELEFAVLGAILGLEQLLPFHPKSPDDFLRQRLGFLSESWAESPESAHPPLAWLAVEHEEALSLVDWLNRNPTVRARVMEKRWLEAVSEIERIRMEQGFGETRGAVFNRLKEALAASASPDTVDPWIRPLTLREAALRPLLMETRAEARKRLEGGS